MMSVNGYKFKTYAPDSTQLVNFPAAFQSFSLEYYLEHTKEEVELLEILIGEKDYQAFLDVIDLLDAPKLQIVWPAIFKADTLMETGKVDL